MNDLERATKAELTLRKVKYFLEEGMFPGKTCKAVAECHDFIEDLRKQAHDLMVSLTPVEPEMTDEEAEAIAPIIEVGSDNVDVASP